MNWRRALALALSCWLAFSAGCSRPVSSHATERHEGAKVNIPNFIANPGSYKGKTMSLELKVAEAIDRGKGQSLRDYAGKEVKFSAAGPKAERLNLVIKIPAGLTVPEVGQSDSVRVTFTCTQGSLSQGNEARLIELP